MKRLIDGIRIYLALVLLEWAFELVKSVPGPESLAILRGINQAAIDGQKASSSQGLIRRK